MDRANSIIKLNEAINKHLERISIEGGNTRYWPQMFVTSDMLNDDDLVNVFRECMGIPINTKDKETDDESNKQINVRGVSAKPSRG